MILSPELILEIAGAVGGAVFFSVRLALVSLHDKIATSKEIGLRAHRRIDQHLEAHK